FGGVSFLRRRPRIGRERPLRGPAVKLTSTMDSASSVLQPAFTLRAKNFVASASFIAIACAIYALSPYNTQQMNKLYGWVGFAFTGREFLFKSATVYVLLLLAYYLIERDPGNSKSLLCVRVIGRFFRSPAELWRAGLAREDRVAVLVTLLKAFFAPMMAMSLMVFLMNAIENGTAVVRDGMATDLMTIFDRHGFWCIIQLILFVDVAVFTVGYLVEMPALHNEIRSVDPTLMGWTAAVICYPPFNPVTALILDSPVIAFPAS